MKPQASILQYAPRPRAQTVRLWAKRVLLAVTLLLLVVVCWRTAERVVSRLRIIRAQGPCLTYRLPPDSVVYDERIIEPTTPAGLVSRPLPARDAIEWTRDYAADAAGTKARATWVVPNPWQTFVRAAAADTGIALIVQPTLFLHARRASPSAPRRLVSVPFSAPPGAAGWTEFRSAFAGQTPAFVAHVFPVASWSSDVGWVRSSMHFSPSLADVAAGSLRFYAGQPDPADESHFTIDYETPDGRGTIDGWLMADDTVKLEVRDGPAARR